MEEEPSRQAQTCPPPVWGEFSFGNQVSTDLSTGKQPKSNHDGQSVREEPAHIFGATPGTTCSLVRLDLLDLIPGKLPGLESKFSGIPSPLGCFPEEIRDLAGENRFAVSGGVNGG